VLRLHLFYDSMVLTRELRCKFTIHDGRLAGTLIY
jgi:hypothetical protein